MSKKKVFLRIASTMNTMPKSERRVAAFIMDNGKKVTQMTLAELASAAGVSEPSVLRCCHRLNYDGYTDMRNDLIRDLAIEANENQAHPQLGLSPNTQIEDVPSRVIYRSISALEDTLKLFNKEQYSSAIEAIHNASFIALFGVANSASIADDAMNKFLRLGKKCSVVSDTHIQLVTALNLKRGDVAIGISHSGKTKETIEAIALAKSTGATVITISNYTSSKLSRYADISFVTADLESDYSSETIVSRICQLSIIDMLYLGVLFSHYPQYQDHLNKLNEEAIKHKFWLVCPSHIRLLPIPPYTPEMNPIEQIWKQLRSMGFRNEMFNSLADVVDRLCETICRLTNEVVKRITERKWIIECFQIWISIKPLPTKWERGFWRGFRWSWRSSYLQIFAESSQEKQRKQAIVLSMIKEMPPALGGVRSVLLSTVTENR